MPQQQAKDIKEKVIKVLIRDESERGSSELRIASWIVNGKVTAPRLERREKYVLQDTGEERPGKAKGLSLSDLTFVFNNKDQILALMQGGTPARAAAPAGAAPAAPAKAAAPASPAALAPARVATVEDDF